MNKTVMNTVRTMVLACVIVLAGLTLAISGCSVPGCFRTPGVHVPTLDPHLIAAFEFPGTGWNLSPEKMLSPDSKHLLVVRSDAQGRHLVAVSLESRNGSSWENTSRNTTQTDTRVGNLTPNLAAKRAQETKFHSLSGKETSREFGYYPLGWISNDKCLFAIFGWMNDGPKQGKRGLSVREGDLEKGKSRPGVSASSELVFEEIPKGYCRSVVYMPDIGKVYFSVATPTTDGTGTTEIKEFDAKKRTVRLVKGGLPLYDGLFNPKLSPDGKYYVYNIYEPNRNGLYILDTATGHEKLLIPAGDNLTFLPEWSDDSRYIAAYTVRKLAGRQTTALKDYNIFFAEDGPMPVGESITVVDTKGKIVKTIEVPGKFLTGFRWSRNSVTLGFMGGTEKECDSPIYPEATREINFDSVWLCDVTQNGDLVKLADISKTAKDRYVYPVVCTPDGQGFFYETYEQEGISVWYASRQKEPVGITGQGPVVVSGGAWGFPSSVYFGDSLLAMIREDNKTSLWLLGSDKFWKFAEFNRLGQITVFGFNENILVIYKGDPNASLQDEGSSQILVYKMTK